MAKKLQEIFKYQREFPGILKDMTKRYDASHNSEHAVANTAPAASITVYKAARAYALMTEIGSTMFGVGKTKNGTKVAECAYQDIGKAKPELVDVCAISSSGVIYAGRADITRDVTEKFIIGPSDRGGTVILLALMDEILSDEEALTCYTTLKGGLLLDPETTSRADFEATIAANLNDWGAILATFSDNIYQRIVHDHSKANIKLNDINASGECKAIQSSKRKNGTYEPVKDVKGTFRYFSSEKKMSTVNTVSLKVSDFAGSYAKGRTRTLSKEEKDMIPKLDDRWVIPSQVSKICKLVESTANEIEPMRNFMLKGPAGTGKTKASELIAVGLELPKVTLTCNADTEVFDFIGQVFPSTNDKPVTGKELTEKYNLPSVDDVIFNTEDAYKQLSGEDTLPLGMDQGEVISLLFSKTIECMAKEMKSEKDFTYVETDFIKALKNGWLVEIQEPTAIIRPGVLVGLNSLLEQGGTITLPTGEQIKRHKDAVVIITTNMDYRGCDGLNQSVVSRMDMVFNMENPTRDMMVQRALERTGYTNAAIVQEMAGIIEDISIYCKQNEIDDGVCGMRELIAWVKSVKVEGEETAYQNCIHTVIEKVTNDEEEQEAIKSSFLENSTFA